MRAWCPVCGKEIEPKDLLAYTLEEGIIMIHQECYIKKNRDSSTSTKTKGEKP